MCMGGSRRVLEGQEWSWRVQEGSGGSGGMEGSEIDRKGFEGSGRFLEGSGGLQMFREDLEGF